MMQTNSNFLKFVYLLAFVIVFLLAYEGIFILNEEVLIVICFTLFIYMSVILLSDVLKASLFSRLVQIKNKFYDLQLSIKKEISLIKNNIENNNIDNEINYIVSDLSNDVNFFENENEISKLNSKLKKKLNLADLSKNSLNNEIALLKLNDNELFQKFNFITKFIKNALLYSYVKKIQINKVEIINSIFNYIKFKEFNYAIKIYEYLAKIVFLNYGNKLNKTNKNISKQNKATSSKK
jgi:hypothetical protein